MSSKNNSATTNKTAIVAYIPVLHEGYQHLIEKHQEAGTVYLLPAEITHQLRSLQKDIRAISEEKMAAALQALYPERTISVATSDILHDLANKNTALIFPEEDISRLVITEYFPENEVIFDTIFLRWDKEQSLRVYPPSLTYSLNSATKNLAKTQNSDDSPNTSFMELAQAEAAKSADWWRQVGAVLVKDGALVLQTHNTHLPNEQAPYILGDPRANFHAGDHIELSTAIHAEAKLIAQAAKLGITLAGTELYCTTFPCPPCAKLIAESGIVTLYFAEGYSMLDGEEVLQNAKVEIIQTAFQS